MPSATKVKESKSKLLLGTLKFSNKVYFLNSPETPMAAVKPYDNDTAFNDHIKLQLKEVAKLKGN